jgi:hypothetical protein
MPRMYAMRRANGEFFTAGQNGLIAVWSSIKILERSRAHNRELDIYRPIFIDRRVIDKIKKVGNDQGLWLVEPVTTDSNLTEGRRIDWNEFARLQSQEAPEPPPSSHPKVRATVQEFQFM